MRIVPKKGESFGELIATGGYKLHPSQVLYYEVSCPHKATKLVRASHLRAGGARSCSRWKNCPAYGLYKTPEFQTVIRHFSFILGRKWESAPWSLKNYKGMQFFDGWNPRKGGSIKVGALWVIENLGRRPRGTTLHIIDQLKGFVPGNLEWTFPKKQANQQCRKEVARLRHEIKRLTAKLRRK
jgi:hypothetical protein